jgi:hypothetical protein
MPLQERTQERKPAEKPTEQPAEQPVAQKGEDLLKFTLAHLPEGCTPDLRACAERFPRPVPYTLKELVTLKGMLKALDEQDAQAG